MTIHAEVVTMLATLNAAFPDVTSYEPSKLRALLRNRRAPLERLPDMRSVEDLAIDGPGGDLSIRVYRPAHFVRRNSAGRLRSRRRLRVLRPRQP